METTSATLDGNKPFFPFVGLPVEFGGCNAKERYTLIGQRRYLKKQHPNVTRATMGPMALYRRTLGDDAIGTQCLRDTDPMALFQCRYHTMAESGREERGP